MNGARLHLFVVIVVKSMHEPTFVTVLRLVWQLKSVNSRARNHVVR